jgi:hypothetical protein
MLREICGDTKVDFLIVWAKDRELYINGTGFGQYISVELREKTLVCLTDYSVYILGIDAQIRQFTEQRRLQLPSNSMQIQGVKLRGPKVILIYRLNLVWGIAQENRIVPVHTIKVDDCFIPESAREFGDYLIIQKQRESTRYYKENPMFQLIFNFAENEVH